MGREIQELVGARGRALLAGDVAGLAELLHPRFAYVDSLGRRLEREAYLLSRGSGEIVFARHRMSDVRVEMLGDGAAVVTCEVEDEGEFRGERFASRCRAVHVVTREAGRWVFLFGQSTANEAA